MSRRAAANSSFRCFSPTELQPFATWAAISSRWFLFAKKSATASGLAPRFSLPGPYLDGDPPSFQPSLVVTNATQGYGRRAISRCASASTSSRFSRFSSRTAYFAIAARCEAATYFLRGARARSRHGSRGLRRRPKEHRAFDRRAPRLLVRRAEIDGRAIPRRRRRMKRRKDRMCERLLGEESYSLTYSEKTCDALIAKFAANQTWQTPTLVLLRHDAYPTPAIGCGGRGAFAIRAERLRFEMARGAAKTGSAHLRPANSNFVMTFSSVLIRRWSRKMQAAGVGILAGTDSAAPELVPGFSLHEELALLTQAGIHANAGFASCDEESRGFHGRKPEAGNDRGGQKRGSCAVRRESAR